MEKCSTGKRIRRTVIVTVITVLLVTFFVSEFGPGARDARLLCGALESGGMAQFQLLLEQGAAVDGTTHSVFCIPAAMFLDSGYPTTPLLAACRAGNTEAVALLLERGADPNKTVPGDFSCIGAVYATAEGRDSRFETVPLLLSHGAAADKTGHGKASGHAAFLEAEYATNETATESIALISAAADDPAHMENGYGNTLLGTVSSTSVAAWLIESGADLNAADQYGNTPLMHAVMGCNKEMAALLLERGARTDIKNNDGKTAYDMAYENGFTDMLDILSPG